MHMHMYHRLQPIHAAIMHKATNPLLRISRTSICPGETIPLEIMISLGRTHTFPNSYSVAWAYLTERSIHTRNAAKQATAF